MNVINEEIHPGDFILIFSAKIRGLNFTFTRMREIVHSKHKRGNLSTIKYISYKSNTMLYMCT